MAQSKSARQGKVAAKNVSAPSKPSVKAEKPKTPTPPSSGNAEQAAPAPPEETPANTDLAKPRPAYATAETMAKAQRNISVSEFFAKNRHLLGFDNPRKALLTTVKEAVDNSLDACEEAGIAPVVEIRIDQLSETQFRVIVQDNGPGIVRNQIPNVFGRLLYGSKFHRLRMSRGQQGIGISAAGMYGLLTTGRPVKITSRIKSKRKANYYELQIDTRKNQPDIIRDDEIDWDAPHGTRVQIELEAKYLRGRQSVDDYLAQTAIANPHVTLVYHAPDGRCDTYAATVRTLPAPAKEIRPHPHGVELGVLLKMLTDSKARRTQQFLTREFSRVSPRVAKEILEKAQIDAAARPSRLNGDGARAIHQAIQQTRIMAPSTDCVVPIGGEQLVAGLRQVVEASFYTAVTRSPAVYRGNPFIIEATIAYGRPEPPEGEGGEPEEKNNKAKQQASGAQAPTSGAEVAASPQAQDQDEEEDRALAKVIRFANRVPLLYQQSACAIYKSVAGMNWRQYGLTQGRGALPEGPLTIVVHMASVWVPFTSESKEAIASYPEILKEIRLALQECGRQLGAHVRKTVRIRQELKKRSYIEKYIPAIGEALRDILELKELQVTRLCGNLRYVLERTRKI